MLINKYKGIKSEIEDKERFIETIKKVGGFYKGSNFLLFGDYLIIEKDFVTNNEYWGFCNKEEFEASYQETDNFIDLNKLKNYTCFTKGTSLKEQSKKVLEEFNEWVWAYASNDEISEGLDVITVMYNYLAMIGLSKEDFDKHIAKLDGYVEIKKYGK